MCDDACPFHHWPKGPQAFYQECRITEAEVYCDGKPEDCSVAQWVAALQSERDTLKIALVEIKLKAEEVAQ